VYFFIRRTFFISRVSVAFHRPRFAIKLRANSNETTPSDDDDEEEEEERESEPAETEREGARKILKFRSKTKKKRSVQKKRNTHRPSGNLIRPRVVDPVRARALRSPFPRDHFFYILSLSQKRNSSRSFFCGGKFKSR
jgi:hypothetical protein